MPSRARRNSALRPKIVKTWGALSADRAAQISPSGRLAVTVTGANGSAKLLYDGKTVSVLSVDKNKCASLAAPAQGGIPAALDELMDKVGHDFPLVDLFSDAQDKAFLLRDSKADSHSAESTATSIASPFPHSLDREQTLENDQLALTISDHACGNLCTQV
jgi:hypothetical protein